MRKILISLFTFAIVLTSLSACSSGITNKRLETDIKSLAVFYLVDKVNDLTILEKTGDSSATSYKISASLDCAESTATADITLDYVKNNGKWVLKNNAVTITKVTPKHDPVVNGAMKNAFIDDRFKMHIYEMSYYSKADYTIISVKRDFANAKATVVVEESYHDNYWSGKATYTLDAVYDFSNGWKFTLKDWVYTESMNWAGTFDLTWDTVLGIPESGRAFFMYNDTMVVTITGTASYDRKKDGTYTDNNTLVAKTVFKGKSYETKIVLDRITNQINLDFDPVDQESWFTLFYQTDQTGTRSFTAEAGYIKASVTRQP